MDNYLPKDVHDEFARRMEDENRRQNHRIDNLENSVKAFGEIANSVNRLATNMETMTTELSRQGERLETLEENRGQLERCPPVYFNRHRRSHCGGCRRCNRQ